MVEERIKELVKRIEGIYKELTEITGATQISTFSVDGRLFFSCYKDNKKIKELHLGEENE